MATVKDTLQQAQDASEQVLWEMLQDEKKGHARLYIMRVLYGKAAKLRAQREQREIAQAVLNR